MLFQYNNNVHLEGIMIINEFACLKPDTVVINIWTCILVYFTIS